VLDVTRDDAPPIADGAREAVALRALAERLTRIGYAEFYASFNPLTPGDPRWLGARTAAPPDLRGLVSLLLFAEAVPRDALEVIDPCIGPLCTAGLLRIDAEGRVSTPGLVLLPVLGYWLFSQRPRMDPAIYFGDDSVALLMRLRPPRDGACLDLCAGPGVQSLFCSGFARRVTAVEVNPVAAALARVNMILNARDQCVTVVCGDLYEPVRGQRFDTVVANPPLLPTPAAVPYPFVGHGGEDGLGITWRILDGLPDVLTPNGTAHIIGTCLSDGIRPLPTDALAQWARDRDMSVLCSVTAHRDLAPEQSTLFQGLITTAVGASGASREFVADEYRALMTRAGGTHLCAFFLHVSRGPAGFRLQDVTPDDGLGMLWYA
jgi:hypothetical protein